MAENTEVKVMTRKERKEAEKEAEWEVTRQLSYKEMVKAKRARARRNTLGIVAVVTTCVAAFGAGKQAAVNEYKKSMAKAPEGPGTGKEFTPADPTPQATFNPGPTWTTEATNGNNE